MRMIIPPSKDRQRIHETHPLRTLNGIEAQSRPNPMEHALGRGGDVLAGLAEAQPNTEYTWKRRGLILSIFAVSTNDEVRDVRMRRAEKTEEKLTAEKTEEKLKAGDLAGGYHPDKNADDPVASDKFQEVTFSYSILSDPHKRRQYDTSGFEAIETDSQELELDLSSLNTVNTMFAAIFSKLGVPIKTTVSATVLEEALNGSIVVSQLQLGNPVRKKVEKQTAHFYSVDITEQEAKKGLVCRVHSTEKSKFKLLYFELEENGGLSLALQEDSVKASKVSSAGMYFLGFPVYRFEQNNSAVWDILNSIPNSGDNFFKSATYTIEIVCAESFPTEKEKLQSVEAKILTKRAELSKFETEYREVLAKFTEMTSKYTQEMQTIDELLNERNVIHASYTNNPPLKRTSSRNKSKSSPSFKFDEEKNQRKEKKVKDQHMEGCGSEDDDSSEKKTKERCPRKRWLNIPFKVDRRKPC
uniref:Chaperone protein dnaJ 16 n=1 Tax=Aegilops tauschii TaxID=37682 RepID=M8B9D3_AEGTA